MTVIAALSGLRYIAGVIKELASTAWTLLAAVAWFSLSFALGFGAHKIWLMITEDDIARMLAWMPTA